MMNVSDAFKQAVNSLERSVVAKLEIYFDGENNPPTIFNRDMIIDFKILEEASADSQNPLGVVSSNELTISLHNKNGAFTISNTNSPYYKKIQKNILVKSYIGVTLEDKSIEYIQMGKYWTNDWKSPSDSLETSVTAYDLLYSLGDKDIPDLPIMINTDIKNIFIALFTALGLTLDDYVIDSNISCRLQYVWFNDSNVKSALQRLSTVGNCTVCMNREGKIYVKSNNTNKAIVATLKDSEQLISSQNIQSSNSIISKVNLTYSMITLSDSVELLSVKQYKLKVGVNSFNNISFSNTPVLTVKRISLLGSTAVVENIRYGVNSVSFDVVSTKKETVDIYVTGIYIIKNDSKFYASNNVLVSEIGEVNLDVSSDIIQNVDTAKSIANEILNIVSLKDSQYTVSSRGNPALELMDNIIIDDVSDRIYMAAITILRQQITWDGALSIDIEGRSLVTTNASFDLNRRISSLRNSNSDTKLIIGNADSISTDTKRNVNVDGEINSDSKRMVQKGVNYYIDTKRGINATQAVVYDIKRTVS